MRSQRIGHGFEPHRLHQNNPPKERKRFAGGFFARAAKEREARFASSSNVKENPLVIANEMSKSLGLSYVGEDVLSR